MREKRCINLEKVKRLITKAMLLGYREPINFFCGMECTEDHLRKEVIKIFKNFKKYHPRVVDVRVIRDVLRFGNKIKTEKLFQICVENPVPGESFRDVPRIFTLVLESELSWVFFGNYEAEVERLEPCNDGLKVIFIYNGERIGKMINREKLFKKFEKLIQQMGGECK